MTNRIIKFRAYDGLNKKFTYWTMNDLCTWDTKDEKPHALDEWEQYTGLKDKQGKEIYEGDILHWYMYKDNGYKDQLIDENLEVRMSNGAWRAGRNEKTFWHEIANMEKEIEIIGNIYENPDLLI